MNTLARFHGHVRKLVRLDVTDTLARLHGHVRLDVINLLR